MLEADAADEDTLVPCSGSSTAVVPKRSEEDQVVLGYVGIVDNAAKSQDEIFVKWGC